MIYGKGTIRYPIPLIKIAGGTINEWLSRLLGQQQWKYRGALLCQCVKSHAPHNYCEVFTPWKTLLPPQSSSSSPFAPCKSALYTVQNMYKVDLTSITIKLAFCTRNNIFKTKTRDSAISHKRLIYSQNRYLFCCHKGRIE